MTDYESPIQPGKNIVVGQACILWGEPFYHPERGPIAGGWILPGCMRTTSGEHARKVCRELNAAIKRTPTAKISKTTPENVGEIIKQQIMGRIG